VGETSNWNERDDPRRLEALDRLALLDSPPEERFDRLARLAATVTNAPIALICLVDDSRRWFKARVGLDADETPREGSFCAHAIVADDDVFVVPDAQRDDRFADDPLVVGDPRISFYAGRVIREPGGLPVGALCVIDRVARDLDPTSRQALVDLGALVEREFRSTRQENALRQLTESERTKGLILETLEEGLVLHDADGRIVDWNSAAERVLGLSAEELSGRTSVDERWSAVHEDERPWPGATHPAMEALRTGRPVEHAIMGVHRPDGSLVWLRVNAHPALDEQGNPISVVAAFEDVTARRELQAALERNERTAGSSLDALEQGVILAEPDGTIHRINPAAERLLGYTAPELTRLWQSEEWETYDEFGAVLPPERRPIVHAIATGETVHGAAVGWRRRDGEMILLRISCVPNADGAGKLVIGFADITAEHAMMRDLRRFRFLFQHANDIITVADRSGRVLFASPSSQRILGYPPDWHEPDGVIGLVHPDDATRAAREFDALAKGERGDAASLLRIRTHAGEWRHMELVGANLLDEPEVGGIVITARDATDRVRLTEQLAHRASHDELTDLPSRQLLNARLSDGLARSIREDRRLGLCFIDLDGFKAVNDSLGHAVGDRLLIDVAATLRQSIRGGDMAARIGGDEFVVVLEPAGSEEEAMSIARRIRDALVELSPDYARPVRFGASIGLALSELDDTPSSLLNRADAALYQAKITHNSSVAVAVTNGSSPERHRVLGSTSPTTS
jgi:diguanylate cyclase (GGDEF)-like protein/PAS domain S-box-containing protein